MEEKTMLEFFAVVIIVMGWALMMFNMDKHPFACFLIPVFMAVFAIPLNYLGPLKIGFAVSYGVIGAILFIAAIKNGFEHLLQNIFDGFSGFGDAEIDYD